MCSITTWITPEALCKGPVTATSRAPITTGRYVSNARAHTMVLAMPVSSSSVMKITPLAVPGRWRTSTSPATVTRSPLRMPGNSSWRRMPRAVELATQERAQGAP